MSSWKTSVSFQRIWLRSLGSDKRLSWFGKYTLEEEKMLDISLLNAGCPCGLATDRQQAEAEGA